MDAAAGDDRLPLEGMRVLDLSRYLSGPYLTMLLADMGADVVKVENPEGGDDARGVGPHQDGESLPFGVPNRNKRSIAIDLKTRPGVQLFLQLAANADVVVENFRPGVVDRLGVGYEAVRGVRPSIVYCSISGFGQTGPLAADAGFDIIAQGYAGFMTMTGTPDSGPVKMGIPVTDLAAGATGAVAVLGAYIQSKTSGRGQHLDVSLLGSALSWTMWEAAAYFGDGTVPGATGSRHRHSAPYQAYRTADGYVTVGANNHRLWTRFCEDVVRRPGWLSDDRYATAEARVRNADELQGDIEAVFQENNSAFWVERLRSAGVPGGPVLTYDDALSHDHVVARRLVTKVDHPLVGSQGTLAPAVLFSETPLTVRRPAPILGQHTRDVLREIGCGPNDIDRLLEAGIVRTAPREDDRP